ncbi:hypothetical protein [Chitinophaga cymbidii]|uniref:Neutral/alkaline non-lysosomal ceramidase N-terminal domain-containing protein n=1 Tax=Chitinophaga cymbidii TaxID=1096750 RepID=A0A512RMK1_9BACT|nr:hypothetical protein [Chitinophaga cymbidii]GEP96900.1 hypothetical protein CCY01nite_31600 [Chitinophaga cymbidii]
MMKFINTSSERLIKGACCLLLLAVICCPRAYAYAAPGDTLKISSFDVDATPPVGSWLVYDKMINSWDQSLRAKGIVLTGAGDPVVLCVIDWIGIANEGYDEFCKALAEAAGTTPDRVALHALHQHDAPVCDFGAEQWLKKEGMDPLGFEGTFAREVIRRLRVAVSGSLKNAKPVTHIGLGQAEVHNVASNRRIVGENGKVIASRTSATKSAEVREKPEGLIDPVVSLISFWNNDKPVAVLSYYATHPQSYYRTGVANPDIPGVARFFRQLAVPDALHLHFNGAGGNITVGKYNDGSHENRLLLAERLADGMQRAWKQTNKEKITAADVTWRTTPVALPPKASLNGLGELLHKETSVFVANNASKLVWLERTKKGKKISLSCLGIGKARMVHLPGECFIEYQLAAKAMRPDLFVTVAAYGDYAPGYIGTAAAYDEGGYETGQASAVTADAEKVLLGAMRKLLAR